MAKKWDLKLQIYEPYTIPESWVCPLYTPDMEMAVNCASCGRAMTFGQGFTSSIIHNDAGMGYTVCEACKEKEWAAEKAARKENRQC